MLYDRQGNRLELRAITGQEFSEDDETFRKLYQCADDAIQTAETVHWALGENKLRAVLGVPLILNERVVGVLGVINPLKKRNFSSSEKKLLEAIASQMDTAIFERMETQRIREVFEYSFSVMMYQRSFSMHETRGTNDVPAKSRAD